MNSDLVYDARLTPTKSDKDMRALRQDSKMEVGNQSLSAEAAD